MDIQVNTVITLPRRKENEKERKNEKYLLKLKAFDITISTYIS